jgi:hypothetical protein
MQDQQNQIEELKTEIANLKSKDQGSIISNNSDANANSSTLFQNVPNPFNDNTVIKIYLSLNIQNAKIVINDATNGKEIKRIDVNERGNISLLIETALLNSGTYTYSLIINDKIVDTKKMLLMR